jgi:oxygen-dependent protoporphyrinogen oxidase
MNTLIEHLVRALAGQLFINTAVKGLMQTEQGWQVQLVSGQLVSATAVVIATPAFVASQLVSGVSSQVATLLNTIDYAPISVVYQAFQKQDLRQPKKGFGVLRCWETPNPINTAWLGSLWSSSIFPDRAPKNECLVSHFFGGSQHRDVLLWSSARASEEATAQSNWLFGMMPYTKPTFTRVFNYANAIPQYTLGHTHRIKTLKIALQQVAPTLQLAGNYLQGINLNSCVVSGLDAAKAIQQKLAQSTPTTVLQEELLSPTQNRTISTDSLMSVAL